jgi:hypothetical protein
MFAQRIRVECVSFFEPTEGAWSGEDVVELTEQPDSARQDPDEESFEAFCRRSLI